MNCRKSPTNVESTTQGPDREARTGPRDTQCWFLDTRDATCWFLGSVGVWRESKTNYVVCYLI